MLFKFKTRIAGDRKTVLIRRDAINAIVDMGTEAHVYINNISTPIVVEVEFKTLENFLGSAFAEGVLKLTETEVSAIIR